MPINNAFRTPPRAKLRNIGLSDNETSQTSLDRQRKISEMINPDGSVTVRRKIFNLDGTSSIVQEEYSSLDRRILRKSDVPNNCVQAGGDLPCLERSSSFSSSSVSTIKTSTSRTFHLSSDFARSMPSARSLRPVDPFHYENKKGTAPIQDPSFISLSTCGVPDTDVSAISSDSMGNPASDTSTVIYNNSNGKSDDDSSWSLFEEPPLPNRRSRSKGSLQGRMPYQDRGDTTSDSTSTDAMTPSKSDSDATTSTSTVLTTSKGSDSSYTADLAFVKEASVMVKPKPKVRYYADPGIKSTVDDYKRGDFRNKGTLFDAPARSGDDEICEMAAQPENEEIVFTVRKKSPEDKIGIFVGVRDLPVGPMLVVTKVSPSGKFAESPITTGDIVVSINGKNFLRDPRTEDALDIVRRAVDRVTFVVRKNGDQNSSRSVDDFFLASLPYHHLSEMINEDKSKTVTREVKNNDGSQTAILECFDPSGRKIRQATRRRWIKFDGSTSDISTVSLTFNGELAILVQKTSKKQAVGLRLAVNKTHRGHKDLVVSRVFPSGLFARTPLNSGDTITSINGVDFTQSPDVDRAMALLSKTEGDISIRALKSASWIERSRRHYAQSRRLEESFTISAPMSRSFEFDDASYGGSAEGYQAAKKLTLRNFTATAGLGIVVKSQLTQWGVLLVASSLAQSSPLAAAGLREGDIILSINGVDFREAPNADDAASLIRSANSFIEIEYQHLENYVKQEEVVKTTTTTKHSFKPDGTKSTRTETRNPDGSISVKLVEIGPEFPLDVAIEEEPSRLIVTSDMSQTSRLDGSIQDHQSLVTEDISVPTGTESSSLTTNPCKPVTITVKKTHKSQDVGISLLVSKGSLYVKKISSGGLLVGKPILPGDTVLAINGRDFRRNPRVRDATSTICNASQTISFRILKTSLRGGTNKLETPKESILTRFCCNNRGEHSDDIANRV